MSIEQDYEPEETTERTVWSNNTPVVTSRLTQIAAPQPSKISSHAISQIAIAASPGAHSFQQPIITVPDASNWQHSKSSSHDLADQSEGYDPMNPRAAFEGSFHQSLLYDAATWNGDIHQTDTARKDHLIQAQGQSKTKTDKSADKQKRREAALDRRANARRERKERTERKKKKKLLASQGAAASASSPPQRIAQTHSYVSGNSEIAMPPPARPTTTLQALQQGPVAPSYGSVYPQLGPISYGRPASAVPSIISASNRAPVVSGERTLVQPNSVRVLAPGEATFVRDQHGNIYWARPLAAPAAPAAVPPPQVAYVQQSAFVPQMVYQQPAPPTVLAPQQATPQFGFVPSAYPTQHMYGQPPYQ